jgi:DNA-binding transcriptional ArsR family regulator
MRWRTVRAVQATTFAALGEPTRLQIVDLLRTRPHAVGGVAETLGIRQPQASKHLAVLRACGVVAVEADGRRRVHRLRGEPFEEIARWADSFEALWTSRLDSLGALLSSRSGDDGEGRP